MPPILKDFFNSYFYITVDTAKWYLGLCFHSFNVFSDLSDSQMPEHISYNRKLCLGYYHRCGGIMSQNNILKFWQKGIM
jgi:hypothetical protein